MREGLSSASPTWPSWRRCIKSSQSHTIRVSTALGGPIGWLLILLSICVLSVCFERLRFWFLWWKRRSYYRHQWLESLHQGGQHPLSWMEDRDLEMGFAQPFLESMSVIAPLIGLMGTVLGLSQLLSTMGPQLIVPDGGNRGGFGDVLVSTALGLGISLMATITFHLNQGFRQWQLSLWRRDLNRQSTNRIP